MLKNLTKKLNENRAGGEKIVEETKDSAYCRYHGTITNF